MMTKKKHIVQVTFEQFANEDSPVQGREVRAFAFVHVGQVTSSSSGLPNPVTLKRTSDIFVAIQKQQHTRGQKCLQFYTLRLTYL